MLLTKTLAQSVFTKIQADISPIQLIITSPNGVILAGNNVDYIDEKLSIPTEYYDWKGPLQSTIDTDLIAEPIYLIPLIYQTRKFGFLGLLGSGPSLNPLMKSVARSANLVLAQEIQEESQKQSSFSLSRTQFLEKWISLNPDQFSNEFILQAQSLALNVLKPHRILLLTGEHVPAILNFAADNMIAWPEKNQLILILDHPNDRIQHLSFDAPAGLSLPSTNLKQAVEQAQRAYAQATALKLPSPVDWSRTQYLDAMIASAPALSLPFNWDNIPHPEDLIETFTVYFHHNGHLQETADALHIHRNTLNYRLENIQKLTTLNPHNYNDLFLLYIIFLNYRLQYGA